MLFRNVLVNKLNFETFSLPRISLVFFVCFNCQRWTQFRVMHKYQAFSLSCMHFTVGTRLLLLLPTLRFSASHVPFISNEYICWLHIIPLSECWQRAHKCCEDRLPLFKM